MIYCIQIYSYIVMIIVIIFTMPTYCVFGISGGSPPTGSTSTKHLIPCNVKCIARCILHAALTAYVLSILQLIQFQFLIHIMNAGTDSP